MTTESSPARETVGTHLDIATPDGDADAYLAMPVGDGAPWPAVVLFMDAFGLRPTLEAMADRLATGGYAVLAPNVFHRVRRSPLLDGNINQRLAEGGRALYNVVMPMVHSYTREQAHVDDDAWLAFLDSRDDVSSDRIGTVGYCMGGRLALRLAGWHPDRVAAMGSFHSGQLATGEPDSPHLDGVHAHGELYFGHADHDRSMPHEQVDRLEAALVGAGIAFTSETYKDAAHGYTQADTPSYDEQASERHWRELTALLDRNLRA